MERVLFICSANRLRSPTAEQIFSAWENIECDSAGISQDATVSVSVEQIQWADIIFVMEKSHRNRLTKKFKPHLKDKRVVVLGIPDDYEFMDPLLIKLLEARVPKFFRTQ